MIWIWFQTYLYTFFRRENMHFTYWLCGRYWLLLESILFNSPYVVLIVLYRKNIYINFVYILLLWIQQYWHFNSFIELPKSYNIFYNNNNNIGQLYNIYNYITISVLINFNLVAATACNFLIKCLCFQILWILFKS